MTPGRRINIVQGEHVATGEPGVVVSTLLGSCIAVCLYDAVAHVGGMNHFLLGQPEAGQHVDAHDMQRYGIHAMELLINAMMKRGAARGRLRAQIYGGATIVAELGRIGEANAEFARRFVATEGIAIGHVDTGGRSARKIEFLPYEGRARSIAVAERIVERVTAPPPRILAPAGNGELELF